MGDARDTRNLRVSRELFLAAFGASRGAFESWVTDRLVSLLEEEEVRDGETLFSAGDTPEFLYFMREGAVRAIRAGHRARCLEGRHVLALIDALLERPYTRTVFAAADLHLMKVRIDAWLELLDDSFEVARASVLQLARIVATLEERLDAVEGAREIVAAAAPGVVSRRLPSGHLNVIERLTLLMDVPLLRGGGVQPLSDLAVASQEVRFERGERIFERAVPRDRIFVVVEGEVEASRDGSDLVRRARAGEIVCGAAAFGEPALAWSAGATRRGRALAFRVDDWFDLMEEHFDMVRSAVSAMSQRHEELLDALD